jgi:hypothetical protein
MPVRGGRLAMAGVVTASCHAFLAGTPAAMKPPRRDRTLIHSIRVMRRPRQACPPPARTAAVIIATAVLAPLAAACSGGSSSGSPGVATASSSASASSSAGSSASNDLVAYSRCMRSHGVPNFPDPSSSGQIPKGSAQLFGVSTSQYQAAQRACQELIPNTGDTAEQQQELQCAQTGNCSRSSG